MAVSRAITYIGRQMKKTIKMKFGVLVPNVDVFSFPGSSNRGRFERCGTSVASRVIMRDGAWVTAGEVPFHVRTSILVDVERDHGGILADVTPDYLTDHTRLGFEAAVAAEY